MKPDPRNILGKAAGGNAARPRLHPPRVGVTTIPAKPGEDVEALLKRDLDAWEMAKAAVARARRRR